MKPLRLLALGAAVVVVLLAAVGIACFSSPVQTWYVRGELAERPDLGAAVGRVDAGWNHLRIENLRLSTAGGAVITVPLLEADVPLMGLLGGGFNFERFVAHGWVADLTAPETARGWTIPGAAGGAPVSPGILRNVTLPFDLSIGQLDLEGEVILPGAEGAPPVRARVSLEGGGLEAGREARFELDASAAAAATAQVSSLAARGSLTVSMPTPRTFSSIGARLDLEARGSSLPNGARLSVTANASAANAGESYTVALRSEGRDLLTVTGTNQDSAGRGRLGGSWMLDMRDADLTPFSLGHALPGFAVRGSGRFETGGGWTNVRATGRLDGTVERLAAVHPKLSGIARLGLTAAFDVAREGRELKIDSGSLDLSDGAPVASLRTIQSFVFDLGTHGLRADAARDLVSVELRGLPAAWIQPFVAGLTVRDGSRMRGALAMNARDGSFSVRSTLPVEVDGISWASQGEPMLADVDLLAQFGADITAQAWQAELGALQIRRGDTILLAAEGKGGQLLTGPGQPVKLQANWTIPLRAWAFQPVLSRLAPLSAGIAAGEIAASLGAETQIDARLSLRELELAADGVRLPDVGAEPRLNIDAQGRMSLQLPLIIQAADRRSDLTFAGALTPGRSSLSLDGRATSSFLALEDAQAVAGIWAAAGGGAVDRAGRPQQPFWAGLAGRIALSARRLVYQGKVEVSNVEGTVRIEEGALRLDDTQAGLNRDGRVTATGFLSFDPRIADAYRLQAEVAAINMESGPFFSALKPGLAPAVEGRFDLVSRVTSKSDRPEMLLSRLLGDFQLSSGGGRARLLRADYGDRLGRGSGAMNSIVGYMGAAAAALGQDRLADLANKGQLVAEVARQMDTLSFDQLNVTLSRKADLDFGITDFTLIAPELRLTGTGAIRHRPDQPLIDRPLDLKLEMRARGAIADLLRRVGLLDATTDSLGYSGFSSGFAVAGTLGQPEPIEFANILLKAAGAPLLEPARPRP